MYTIMRITRIVRSDNFGLVRTSVWLLQGMCVFVCTCVLLDTGEGLLKCVSGSGALGGVWRQAVGVDRLHRMTIGLRWNASEAIDDGGHYAGHS